MVLWLADAPRYRLSLVLLACWLPQATWAAPDELFRQHCAACHGPQGTGATGIPDLTDTNWQYGGSIADIERSITYGRESIMPALGNPLGAEGLQNVVSYVQSLSSPVDASADQLDAGADQFRMFCASCHGPQGAGTQALGAPDLTDTVWLYGGDAKTISDVVANGRANQMPGFTATLTTEQIKSLAAYVQGLAAAAQRYSILCDDASGLCWQDPQRAGFDMADPGLVASEAARYCEELELGGYDDWRLPDSNELRGLIAGNPATESGGQCKLTIGGKRNETLFRACEGGEPGNGPGAAGCYLHPELTGSCTKPGPAYATQYLEHWAANRPSDDAEGWQAYVSFDRGALGYNHNNSAGDARCVRTAKNLEATDGFVMAQDDLLPENLFVADFFDLGEHDACLAADKLDLNINLPEPLDRTPAMLMVFFYAADQWKFPPAGPPDGGTDYNTIREPQFAADGSLQMTLPGCTFYREVVLTGDYRVFVQLLMEKRRPPMVSPGDYYWGSNDEVFALPLNGASHRGASRSVDITLWPVVN